MTRLLLAFLLASILIPDYFFGQTLDTVNRRAKSGYVNLGPSISLGPEVIISQENLYGLNANFRFWYRSGGAGHVRADNTFNLSAGFFRILDNNLFKLKAGDLILLTSGRYGAIRLGLFADYYTGHKTQLLAIDACIGLRLPSIYFYLGAIQPITARENSFDISTSFSFGLDFYIFERKTYFN